MKPSVELICNVLKIGKATYYRYKKSDEPILRLINYLSKEELEELISTGKVEKLEENSNFSKVESINEIFIDDAKFRLKDKLKRYTDDSFINWMNKMIPKKILISTLKQIADNKEKYTMSNSKYILLERIQTLELSFINEKNRHQITNYINDNLSKIECYVLIQEHEEIMNYKGFWK